MSTSNNHIDTGSRRSRIDRILSKVVRADAVNPTPAHPLQDPLVMRRSSLRGELQIEAIDALRI